MAWDRWYRWAVGWDARYLEALAQLRLSDKMVTKEWGALARVSCWLEIWSKRRKVEDSSGSGRGEV